MKEIWDLYDKDRRVVGKIARDKRFSADEYHLVVHVCIFNDDDEMLIQLRSPHKLNWRNKWDFSAGGAAIEGEDSKTAAERETMEELGINLDLSNERPVLTVHFDEGDEKGFDDYYVANGNFVLDSIVTAKREISNVKWASKSEIIAMIKRGEFVDVQPCFIDLIFAMYKRRSIHIHSRIIK